MSTTFQIRLDEELKQRMDEHAEINWSEVARRAIQAKIDDLELMESIASRSQLTEEDVEELAALIDKGVTERAMRDLEDYDGEDIPLESDRSAGIENDA